MPPRAPTKPTPEAEQEAVRRAWRHQLAYEFFKDYARMMWDVAEPAAKCIWGKHMDIVCDEVQAVMEESDRRRRVYEGLAERLSGEELERAVNAELGHLPRLRLVLLVPPRQSKSTIVGRLFPTWRWLHRPQDQILILTAVDDLIERDGLRVRDTLKHPDYLALQEHLVNHGRLPPADPREKLPPNTSFGLRADQFAKEKFQTTAGGARHGYTIGGRFVGVNADVIVIDDPHDISDAMNGSASSQLRSMTEVRNDYKDKIQDRLSSQIWGVVILIMQRVHVNDLADYMIATGAKVCCLPAEYDPTHPHVYKPGSGYVPNGKDWRTIPGEPINPLRLPEAAMRAMREESPFGYATKFLMRPSVQEGVRYKREWFGAHRRYGTALDWKEVGHRLASQLEEVAISIDAAEKTGDRNDYTSMQVWGRKGSKRVLLDRRHGRFTDAQRKQHFRELREEWPEAAFYYIEDKSGGTQLADHAEAEGVVGVVRVIPKGDKESRSGYAEASASEGNVWIPNAPWADEFVESVVGFGAGAIHDDDVDAMSQVFKRWATAPRAWITREERERLNEGVLGVSVGLATRWGKRDSGATYYLGVVPGWANGGSPAVAAFVDSRGRLVSVVEVTGGGVDAFVGSLVSEADYWSRLGAGRYAETEGLPTRDTIRALSQARVRVAAITDKMPGDPRAGWTGKKRETADLWQTFLSAIGEGRVGLSDGRTLAQLETIVEEDGVPRFVSGEPLGGRVLALLLAISAMKAATPMETHGLPQKTEFWKVPADAGGVDLWAMGARR